MKIRLSFFGKRKWQIQKRFYSQRKKTNILPQVNDYIKNSKLKISVFVEDRTILESLKPYPGIYNSLINRITSEKSDVLMFFDYPADEDVMQSILLTVCPNAIHYMNYVQPKYDSENILKTFSGMIRYTCNTLNGDFNLTRAASALGITNAAVETMLEVFEDTGMIKINERGENSFKIDFLSSVELSKALNIPKFEEFMELLNGICEYKNHFMTSDI